MSHSQHSMWWCWCRLSARIKFLASIGRRSSKLTCWKHWIATPRETLRKFWPRPPVNSSRREALPDFCAAPYRSGPNSSINTASLIAWNVLWTFPSEGGLSSRADITAIASAGRLALRSLTQNFNKNREEGLAIPTIWEIQGAKNDYRNACQCDTQQRPL